MADNRSRQLGRKGENPDDLARLVSYEIKTKSDQEVLETILKYTPEVRASVFDLLVEAGEDEGRLAVLKVLSMMNEQVPFARENAVRVKKGDVSLPEREAIMAAVMRELSSERAKAILQFNEARLVLVPVTGMGRAIDELLFKSFSAVQEEDPDADMVPRSPSISEFFQDHPNVLRSRDIRGWLFVIAEGARIFDAPPWDNHEEVLRQRVERCDEVFSESGLSRMDYLSYIALMIQRLRDGKPIDYEPISSDEYHQQYTVLSETSEDDQEVGAAYWEGEDERFYLDALELDLYYLGEDDNEGEVVFRGMISGAIN